ncbi:hypothetical protein AB0I10_17850 [Streptomyces sp. NPDC050636]|uniref:COG4315 family predicted lipoprotein n=1 Tax=Streptomyces sp. NPDC050636 TaxID=3154510 RepID=UPI003438B7FB
MSAPISARTRRSTRTAVAAATAALFAVALGGCSDNGGGAPEETPTPTTVGPSGRPSASPTAGAGTVNARSGKLGEILVDGQGRTLYLFEADSSEKSTCSGGCAKAWPPVIVTGTPKAGGGVKGNLLGTTTRSDGAEQVTYNGHPLYYFEGDQQSGDTNGQALDQFGDEWYVVDTSGNKIEKEPENSTGGGVY